MSSRTPSGTGGTGPSRELLIETVGRVRVLTMNRPERLNALSESLMHALTEAFVSAGEDPEVWVVVLTGGGNRAFSAGMDLKELRAADAVRSRPFRPPMARPERLFVEVLAELYKPTIAAINGAAIGGGFELALACDIRIATEGTRFALPEAKVGMGAIFGCVVLPRMIPIGRAFELMYTGDYLDVDEAASYGLVNRVVPSNELMSHTLELAQRISENAPITIRRMKEMALKGRDLPLPAALRLDVGPNPYTADDRQIGIKAFLDKEKPQWTGR